LSAIGVYRYTPLTWLETAPKPNFGSTITTIQGTDTLSSSRTVINNNFSSLNNGKIEVGSTSIAALTTAENLATIGTILSGVWNGTPITGAFGGTSSTTLSINQVMLGNTTSGLKAVVGYGASGDVLTSQGTSNTPIWSSGAVNTSLDYNWTGTNLFKLLVSSTTVNFNDGGSAVALTFPNNQGASSTILMSNGSGVSVWSPSYPRSLAGGYDGTESVSGATSTVESITIPANTLKVGNGLKGEAIFTYGNFAGSNLACGIGFGNGTATTSITYGIAGNSNLYQTFSLFSTSTTAQITESMSYTDSRSTPSSGFKAITAATTLKGDFYTAYDTTTQLYLSYDCFGFDSGGTGKLTGYMLQLIHK
jgi:hypothetical protein